MARRDNLTCDRCEMAGVAMPGSLPKGWLSLEAKDSGGEFKVDGDLCPQCASKLGDFMREPYA